MDVTVQGKQATIADFTDNPSETVSIETIFLPSTVFIGVQELL